MSNWSLAFCQLPFRGEFPAFAPGSINAFALVQSVFRFESSVVKVLRKDGDYAQQSRGSRHSPRPRRPAGAGPI